MWSSSQITHKPSFKELYPGTYTHQACYKDDVDNTDAHINQSGENSRY
ncbi:MAG: hypothetical protein J5618_03455 [Bacilli bacterium]|nr:hypothetical protein [Bacilli bacterium]